MNEKARMPEADSTKIWDMPTRLFHWTLVILIALSWWSHPMHMEWHRASGYTILALVVFRVIWGVVGATTSRFRQFMRGPETIMSYLRQLCQRKPVTVVGHNPVGGWSVMIMLCVLAFQVVSGLFAVDVDGIESGALSDRVDFDTGRWFATWHGASFTLLEILIGAHVAAILFYLLFKRSNLIAPMLTGRARGVRGADIRFAAPWKAILAAFTAAVFAWWASTGFRG